MKHGKIDPNADLEFFTLDDLHEEHDRLRDQMVGEFFMLDNLDEEHDRLRDRMVAVELRIWGLEQDIPNDTPTGFRAMYYAIK